jgi:hypothetical protein
MEVDDMEFRWVIFIALWTILSGPVFGPSLTGGRPKAHSRSAAKRKHTGKSPDRTPWKYTAPKSSR